MFSALSLSDTSNEKGTEGSQKSSIPYISSFWQNGSQETDSPMFLQNESEATAQKLERNCLGNT